MHLYDILRVDEIRMVVVMDWANGEMGGLLLNGYSFSFVR